MLTKSKYFKLNRQTNIKRGSANTFILSIEAKGFAVKESARNIHYGPEQADNLILEVSRIFNVTGTKFVIVVVRTRTRCNNAHAHTHKRTPNLFIPQLVNLLKQ